MSINENFKIAANAVTFKLLTEKLYTMPFFSTIRELVNNAYDSYVELAKEKNISIKDIKPIELNITDLIISFLNVNYNIRIRDYGTGLSKESMEVLYTTYFGSNKGDRDDLVGGFGIGSKSPLSLTSEFMATSYYNGMKYTYLIFLDTQGMPSFTLLQELETNEENGLEIMFQYDNVNEINNFLNNNSYYSINFLKFYPISFTVNNSIFENTYYKYMAIYDDNELYTSYEFQNDQINAEIIQLLNKSSNGYYNFTMNQLYVKIKNNIYMIDDDDIISSIYNNGKIIELKKPLDLKLSREAIELNKENRDIFDTVAKYTRDNIYYTLMNSNAIKESIKNTNKGLINFAKTGIINFDINKYWTQINEEIIRISSSSYYYRNNKYKILKDIIDTKLREKNKLQYHLYNMLNNKDYAMIYLGIQNYSGQVSFRYNSGITLDRVSFRLDDNYKHYYVMFNISKMLSLFNINTDEYDTYHIDKRNFVKVNNKYINALSIKKLENELIFSKITKIQNIIIVVNKDTTDTDIKNFISKNYKDMDVNIIIYTVNEDKIDPLINTLDNMFSQFKYHNLKPIVTKYINTSPKINYNYLIYQYNKDKQYTELVDEVNSKSSLVKSIKVDDNTIIYKSNERLNDVINQSTHDMLFYEINRYLTNKNKDKAEIKVIIVKNIGKEQDEFVNKYIDKKLIITTDKDNEHNKELARKVIMGTLASMILTHKHENYIDITALLCNLPIGIIMKETPRYDILEKVYNNAATLDLDKGLLKSLLDTKEYFNDMPKLINELLNNYEAKNIYYSLIESYNYLYKFQFYNAYKYIIKGSKDEIDTFKHVSIDKKIYFNIKIFVDKTIEISNDIENVIKSS